MPHPPILLTGFASPEAVPPGSSALLMERMAGVDGVVTEVLPLEYAAADRYAELIDGHGPAAAIAFADGTWSDFLIVERLAWNIDESEEADAAGVVRAGMAIAEDGPAAYGSGIPVPVLMQELARAGVPVSFGDHGGGFVENHLYYSARHRIETLGLDTPMVLLRLPPLPERLADQPGRHGMAMERAEFAARTLVELMRTRLEA